MSQQLSPTPDKAKDTASSSARGPAAATAADFARLDARLKKLADTTLQTSPYILTVPSTRPYNVDPRQAHEWKRGTPFDEHEEQLQYLSFLPDWDAGLIAAVGAWQNEHGEVMDRSHSQQSAKSGTSTPAAGAKKVKHSLSDYMKKATGQSTPAASQEVKREPRKQENGSITVLDTSTARRDSGQALKRSREDGEVSESDKSKSAKKMRPSPPGGAARKKDKELNDLDLPPFISPTLPPAIEKELAKISKISDLDGRETPKSRPKPSPAADRRSPDKPSRPTHSDAPPRVRENGLSKAASNEKSAKLDHRDSSGGVANGVASKRPVRSAEPRPAKIVKLKIPKAMRINVERLLQMPQPRPRGPTEGYSGKFPAEGSRSRDKLSPHSEASRKDKRHRSDSELDGRTPPLKRSKHPSALDLNSKSTTPVPDAFRSPTASQHGSAQRKSAARSHPAEKTLAPSSYHQDEHHSSVATPQAPARNGTPSAPDSADRGASASKHPRKPLHSLRVREELRETEAAHIELGRQCKRASDRELNVPNARSGSSSYRKGLALGAECVLAFMLSYAARDELNSSHTIRPEGDLWASVIPYIGRIKEFAGPFPHLRGLMLQLEAVCHMASWANACEVSRDAAAAADDGGGRVTKSLRALMKQHQHASELFAEGAAELPTDALQHSFPATWRAKAGVPLARAASRTDMRAEGDFYLPLSGITTPVEAVRAGRALLIEWGRSEDIDWTPLVGRPRSKDGGGSRAPS